MKEELGMVLARNEAKILNKKKDFSDAQEEMEIPLKRERLCTGPESQILGMEIQRDRKSGTERRHRC